MILSVSIISLFIPIQFVDAGTPAVFVSRDRCLNQGSGHGVTTITYQYHVFTITISSLTRSSHIHDVFTITSSHIHDSPHTRMYCLLQNIDPLSRYIHYRSTITMYPRCVLCPGPLSVDVVSLLSPTQLPVVAM